MTVYTYLYALDPLYFLRFNLSCERLSLTLQYYGWAFKFNFKQPSSKRDASNKGFKILYTFINKLKGTDLF